MIVTEWEAMFISNTTELEMNFSQAVESRLAQVNPAWLSYQPILQAGGVYTDGIIPVTTFTSWPWNEDRRAAIKRPRSWPTPANCGGMDAWPPMAGGRVCDSVWYGLGAQGQNDAAIDYELRRYG